MNSLKLIGDLLSAYDPVNPNFRPSELFNEGWLLKLILHQAAKINDSKFPLGFLPQSTWFSEALLPSAFQPRFRGDKLGESRTNADGIIGQIHIGRRGKADLELAHDATQFTVVEAKIRSPLSPGTSNARYFDQAARNVACMAEILARSNVNAANLKKLDFIVLAPQESINAGMFKMQMAALSIKSKVERRVSEYDLDRDDYQYQWFEKHFLPLIEKIRLLSLSWEEAIDWIRHNFPQVVDDFNEYYRRCLDFA